MKTKSYLLFSISATGIVVGNIYTYSVQISQLISKLIATLAIIIKAGTFIDLVGLTGVGIYVASYISLQTNRVDGNSVPYCLANSIAAGLVLISLVQNFNLASVTIQVIWIAISLYGLQRCRKR